MGFGEIVAEAERRVGADALTARLPDIKTPEDLKSVSDDRYLSTMALRVFRAGLKHSLVDAKWPAFEDAFAGFDPVLVALMSDEALEALMGDARLIRHWGKIKSVRANAAAMRDVAEANGSMGAWLAEWPSSNIIALWATLARRFSQMGGASAPAFLRMAGKDTFMLTDFVVRALNHWGAFTGTPKSKADRTAVQATFNAWADETGRPLAHVSMILAASVD